MNIHEFRKMVDDIADMEPGHSDKVVTVRVLVNDNQVYGGTPSSRVTGIVTGFDWDHWQIMIQCEDVLKKA